ncbi:MAG TPA: hypothetical protein VFI70_00815 [Nitrososphaeraceae archaeon]|jgi:hypothetical protein|nr:hypothetical protein [Nitrososphaeraceae archaeon]
MIGQYIYALNPNNDESAPGRVLVVIQSSSSSYHGSLVSIHFLLSVTAENGNKENATTEG